MVDSTRPRLVQRGPITTITTAAASASNRWHSLLIIFRVLLPFPIPLALLVLSLLPNGNLDSLGCEAFTQRGAFADTGKLLGRIDLERLAEDLREDFRFSFDQRVWVASLNIARRLGGSQVNE